MKKQENVVIITQLNKELTTPMAAKKKNGNDPKVKKVFISYSHDSDEHRNWVLALSNRLRDDGIETILDLYINGSPEQGWSRWMMDQLDAADFVLVVCTETYYRRFRGKEEPVKGKGVDWEGALITQEVYDSRSRTLKFVPVFLGKAVVDCIPEPLRQFSYYVLTSKENYQRLYDFLLERAGVTQPPIGEIKPKPRFPMPVMTFPDTTPVLAFTDNESRIEYPQKLHPFEYKKDFFTHRGNIQRTLESRVNQPGLTVLVGPSGSGKTSLLRSILDPYSDSQQVHCLQCTPGDDPYIYITGVIASAISQITNSQSTGEDSIENNQRQINLRKLFGNFEEKIIRHHSEMRRSSGVLNSHRLTDLNVVLVFDDLDNFFTNTQAEAQSKFINELFELQNILTLTHIVLVVSSEYYGRLRALLLGDVKINDLYLREPDVNELNNLLDNALTFLNISIEKESRDALVNTLMKLRNPAERLPRLACLLATWAFSVGSADSYVDWPKVLGSAIDNWAEERFRNAMTACLPQEPSPTISSTENNSSTICLKKLERLAHRIFLRLVHLQEPPASFVGACVPKNRDLLVSGLAPESQKIIKTLISNGLLVVVDTLGNVSLAHGAILDGWLRLRSWLNDARLVLLHLDRLEIANRKNEVKPNIPQPLPVFPDKDGAKILLKDLGFDADKTQRKQKSIDEVSDMCNAEFAKSLLLKRNSHVRSSLVHDVLLAMESMDLYESAEAATTIRRGLALLPRITYKVHICNDTQPVWATNLSRDTRLSVS